MPDPAAQLSDGDAALLAAVQSAFPLTPRPFAALGEHLGEDEDAVLARYRRLRGDGLIRQTSAIVDTERVGYQSTLVATRVAADRVDDVAGIVSAHPGVSHNYRRDHDFNLWWTLAVPPEADLGAHAHALHRRIAADATRLLPTITRYKIGVRLDVGGQRAADAMEARTTAPEGRAERQGRRLTPDEVVLVRELQEDLPVEARPFAPMAGRLGTTEDDVVARAQRLVDEGLVRRVAAVLRHRRAGFSANAMSVWQAPAERVDEAGERLAAFAAVTHCYRRLTHPDWPYPLFAMVHATSREHVDETIASMRAHADLDEPLLLYSTVEYKKVRLRLFDPAHGAWGAEHVTDEDRAAAGASPHAW